MKFSITNTLLAALAFGTVSGKKINIGLNDNNRRIQNEDVVFWKTFIMEELDSMVTPTTKPSAKPIDLTPDPTPALIETISDAPSDGPNLNVFSSGPSSVFTSVPISVSTSVPISVPTSVPTIVPSTPACKSIETILCSVPEFSTLCGLVGTTGLSDALNEDIFTIFAPTNDAFESIPAEFANAVKDIDILRDVLLYHAVPEVEILAENLVCDANVMMANLVDTTTVCTGDEIFQVGNGNFPDVLPKLIAQDGIACNGIIHAIDQVIIQNLDFLVDTLSDTPTFAPSDSTIETTGPTLEPSNDPQTSETCESITEVVCALPEFQILCALVEDTDLAGVLGGEDQFTIFAPTNDAFTSLSVELADTITSDLELLKDVLLSHTVSGAIFSIDLACGGELAMVSGEEITTVCVDDLIFQIGAGNTADSLPEIIAPDGVACNGVIHAINKVILPSLDTTVSP